MKPMYQRKRGLLRIAAIGQVIIMAGTGCKSSSPKQSTGINDVSVSQALVGKDGSLALGAGEVVLNRYSAVTADAAVGDHSITVTNLTELVYDTKPLGLGDLVLIIQMAGATIDVPADPNDPGYGAVSGTNLNSAGRYEFAGVTGVSGTDTISLSCGLKHGYSAAGKAQVVRVPQFTNLTIPDGTTITADPWDGAKGGVVAIHAMNTIAIDATGGISVKGQGFRGGQERNETVDPGDQTSYYSSVLASGGGAKGEGIADLGTNLYGRGAAANAGGGGNWHNAGGGGGANASASGTWTGQGVMSAAVLGSAAWAQDPQSGSDSPGGGRGGYTWSNNDGDAINDGPGDTAWGGSDRQERGGLGGRPLPSSTGGSSARLFMGGGGGAGNANNNNGSSGGNGGGLVFLIAGTVTGSGTINADGDDGDPTGRTGDLDAAGGGGGGGTVVVHAGLLSGITIRAHGGVGGIQDPTTPGDEAEGPGGGGGGGFIALSGVTPAGATAVSATATGGPGGITTSAALTEFPSNGATSGHNGISNASAASLMYCTDDSAPRAVILDPKPSDPTISTTATFHFASVDSNSFVDAGDRAASFECSLDGAAFTACPPTYIVEGLGDGWHTMDVRVVDLSGNDAGAGSQATYRWRVDLIAPVPWIVSGPGGTTSGGTTNSTVADFTINATERDGGVETITFLCRLDSDTGAFTPCNNTGTATPTYIGLTEGTHTLDVRARDDASDAGNVTPAADTVRWTWTVHALTDAGDDAEGDDAGDTGPVDAPGLDALILADAADAEEGIDTAGVVVLDASPDLTLDTSVAADRAPDSYRADTSVSFGDAARDSADAEAGLFVTDARSDATDALSLDGMLSSDSGAVDSSLPQDTAVPPAPSPDAYVPPPDTAVKPSGKQDAAISGDKLMGGGFCSMNPSGHSTPGLATLFLVAAFGLMIVRRRRR